jgi:phospholipid/cholesterol/gamma-HCH transport system substrate-binding protein
MLDAIQQQKGAFGKFIYDPAIHDSARQFLDKGNGLMDDIKNGKGTISKLLYDDSLFATYKQAGTNLANATAKLDSNEGTLGKMFNDPKLYDNITGLTGDLRLFMTEFQKNPKKYLSIQLKIF